MLMIIIPMIIIVAVIMITTSSITYFSTSKMSFDPSFGSYLLYKTQFNVSLLEDKMKSPDESDGNKLGAMDKKHIAPLRVGITKSEGGMESRISDAVLDACAKIQKDGSEIMILAGDEIIYKTVEADVYEMVGAVIDICGKSLSDINSPFVTSDDSGTVVTDVFSIEGEGVVKIIVVNKKLSAIVSSGMYNGSTGKPIRGNNIFTIAAVVAVVAIIITNGLLVLLMLKSIMEPLSILQTATHELRDGNLDYKVPYRSKNEIGQVCADFEEMRQRLKESVEQQQKYEDNRMQLVAGISHDLGTPLTTIKGYASGILDGIADTDEKKMRYVSVIYDTAQGMDTLVSELSMLSKLSLDKIPFYFERIGAKDFFDEFACYASDTLGEAGIEFIYNFECDGDTDINIDPAQFRRVLNNLIDNSRKYGAEDGTAKIMLSVADGEKGRVEICIEDNGRGVPEDEREKFDNLEPEYSHLYLAASGRLAGVICIADPLRPEASRVLRALRGLGITNTVMMTGDSERTAAAIAKQVGVDQFFAEVLPEDKAAFVQKAKSEGHTVVMIGDGINDSPALSAADVGIAINSGAAIAREIADVTIKADSLEELVILKTIANSLQRRVSANYHFVLTFNSALIALGAMGILQPASSAMLHNLSTIGISLKSMTNLIPEEKAQKALAEKN